MHHSIKTASYASIKKNDKSKSDKNNINKWSQLQEILTFEFIFEYHNE